MTLGTLGVGERFGAPSENRGEAYLSAAMATLGAPASAALGNAIFRDYYVRSRVALGFWCGLFPNAFLNAYVYNRVKKPKADAASSRFSASPYVAAYRGGRAGDATPVYGLSIYF